MPISVGQCHIRAWELITRAEPDQVRLNMNALRRLSQLPVVHLNSDVRGCLPMLCRPGASRPSSEAKANRAYRRVPSPNHIEPPNPSPQCSPGRRTLSKLSTPGPQRDASVLHSRRSRQTDLQSRRGPTRGILSCGCSCAGQYARRANGDTTAETEYLGVIQGPAVWP